MHDEKQPWTQRLVQLVEDHDAFVLMPFDAPKDHEADQGTLDRLFTFFSLIVARQLDPRSKDKPLIVYNPREGEQEYGNGWQPYLDLYDELRGSFMIADDGRLLAQEAGSREELHTMLETSREHWLPNHPDGKVHTAHPVPDQPEDAPQFKVGVFTSATMRNDHLNKEAHEVGTLLAKNGFGVVFGAADDHMMGEVLKGAREEGDKDKVWIGGSSTEDILNVEAREPQAVKDTLNEYFDAHDIYERMEYMFSRSDAYLVLPGGAGTVQELAALLMLKSHDDPIVQDKPIVVLNSRLQADDGTIADQRFYNSLLDMLETLPPEQKDKLDLHICNSTREAEQTLTALSGRHEARAIS
jgi:uncharacterized protein (TIGR00730 family)